MIFKTASRFLLDLLYPKICLNCQEPLSEGFNLFCQGCSLEIAFSDPKEYCRTCFTYLDEKKAGLKCFECQKHGNSLNRVLGAIEPTVVAHQLQKRAGKYATSFLIRGSAALMTVAYLRQKLPMPEVIIPLPESLFTKFKRGFSCSEKLAKNMAKHFQVKSISALKESTEGIEILEKWEEALEDKHLLLVGAECLPSRRITQAADALASCYPRSITAVTLTSVLH